jgi:hypothetical protein
VVVLAGFVNRCGVEVGVFLLVAYLLGRFLVGVADGRTKTLDRAAQVRTERPQALRAEYRKHDYQDDQQLYRADV